MPSLLELDGRALLFELLLELLGLGLLEVLLDGLRSAFDEVLGLLEAQARGRADDLDDLDLLVAAGLEDDVERALGLFGRRSSATAPIPSTPSPAGSGTTKGIVSSLTLSTRKSVVTAPFAKYTVSNVV